jgi:hypothetical protein
MPPQPMAALLVVLHALSRDGFRVGSRAGANRSDVAKMSPSEICSPFTSGESQSIQSQSSSTGSLTSTGTQTSTEQGQTAPVPLRARKGSRRTRILSGAEPAVFDDGPELAQSFEHDGAG